MRVLKWFAVLLMCAVWAFVSGSLLLFHGPFTALKDYVMDSVATSRHGYLLRPASLYTVSQAEINAHNANLIGQTASESSAAQARKDFTQVNDDTVTVEDYQGDTFSAKIMLIRDPKRIKVGVTKYLGDVGQSVSDMVQENHAVAGINGGSFKDVGYQGTGGAPLGVTMTDGQIVESGGSGSSKQAVIGLTAHGALIAGSYTLNELRMLNVREALSFGPVLVQNGEGLIRGTGGWGYAPRSAIGQRSDGTIIFIVTDGRFIHGASNVGASLKDVEQLMLNYGAVVAANLDGGSSSTLVYNGKLINEPTDILGERKVASAFLVMPSGGGTQ